MTNQVASLRTRCAIPLANEQDQPLVGKPALNAHTLARQCGLACSGNYVGTPEDFVRMREFWDRPYHQEEL